MRQRRYKCSSITKILVEECISCALTQSLCRWIRQRHAEARKESRAHIYRRLCYELSLNRGYLVILSTWVPRTICNSALGLHVEVLHRIFVYVCSYSKHLAIMAFCPLDAERTCTGIDRRRQALLAKPPSCGFASESLPLLSIGPTR